MNFQMRDGLPYVTVTLLYGGQQLDLAYVLLNAGSAGTIFAAELFLAVALHTMRMIQFSAFGVSVAQSSSSLSV